MSGSDDAHANLYDVATGTQASPLRDSSLYSAPRKSPPSLSSFEEQQSARAQRALSRT